MSWRILLALAASFGLAALSAAVVLGQDAPGARGGPPGDTFPAALGYAVIALVTTAGATMSAVVTKLYRDIAAVKKAAAASATEASHALIAEKDARREEAERLLREQQVVLREVLAGTNSKRVAYEKLTDAVQANTMAVQSIMKLIGER